MQIAPWHRRGEPLAHREDIEDLFSGLAEPFGWMRGPFPTLLQANGAPPMNVSETEDHYLVSLEVPGMDPEDISIERMGNQLVISGERKWEEEKKGKEFHRVESRYGTFSRSLVLPENLRLDPESIEATFEKGVLEVRVPKVEPTPAAKIPITSK